MDDKAEGVSGVPWTKALWPSALAWLSQSLALLTAEWNVEWNSMSSRDLLPVAKRGAVGQLENNFEKTLHQSKMSVEMLTLLLQCLDSLLKTFVALSWFGCDSHEHRQTDFNTQFVHVNAT